MHASNSVRYIGVMDHDIDLFEGQYTVPQGVSYNSYVILDEKIAVMDTVDAAKTGEWMENLARELAGRSPDYLIVSHLEPDHSGSLQALAKEYPGMTLVMTERARAMLPQFFPEVPSPVLAIKEGDCLPLGGHTLRFIPAPMVHWPEVMVSYEESEQILFSADGFGTFGPADGSQEWLPEARRYYINIVGKYGAQVQALLKKAAGLEIRMLCPLHGPILRENLSFYLEKYQVWSSYAPEEKGVAVIYASFHGNTAGAARKMAELLRESGEEKAIVYDLSRDDKAAAIADAFRFDRLVLCCVTYDGGIHPKMEDFLLSLKAKNYRKRQVALIENGSWAPQGIKRMRACLETMPAIHFCEKTVTIRTGVKPETVAEMREMARMLQQE